LLCRRAWTAGTAALCREETAAVGRARAAPMTERATREAIVLDVSVERVERCADSNSLDSLTALRLRAQSAVVVKL
jgi:hypothetical protein